MSGGVAIVLFSDLVESTSLLARLGDERMERLLRAHLADVQEAVERNGGRVIKSIGDGAMAHFTSALGALRAGGDIQRTVADLDAREGGLGVRARVGISAGEPIATGADLNGMTVVIAARLCAAAASGEVLVHDVVCALAGGRAEITFGEARSFGLKGVPQPVIATALDIDTIGRAREAASEALGAPEEGAAQTAAGLTPSGGAAPSAGAATPPADATPPLSRVLAAYAEEALVGREAELARLRDACSFAANRHAVVLLGEPGIGKTRLAAAAAECAHAAGAVVVLARCPPEPRVAFEPWVRAIGELAASNDPAPLAAAAGPDLAALVPEFAAPAPAAPDAEGARYRVLRGVGAAFAAAAGDRPLCIVLDDAHWCDQASAQVLAELLERPPVDRLLLVVTARDRDLGRTHPVSRTLAELRRTRSLDELSLDGLDAAGVAALVAARIGRAIHPRVARRLLARTAGNPFFAGELAHDLEDLGALSDEQALDAAPVPDAVTGLVEERLTRLDTPTRDLLVAAAAIGPTAPVALAATAAGLDATTADRAVDLAVEERLVDESLSLERSITFPHALIREAFAAMPAPAASARLHHAIAEALEAAGTAEPSQIARHRALAAPVAGAEPAVAAHRLAAAAASADHDHESAADHLDQAVALMPAGQPERGRLLFELGEARMLSADLRRARKAYDAAAAEARGRGDVELLARAAIGFAGGEFGFGFELGTDDTRTVTLLQEALALMHGERPVLELAIVARLLYATIMAPGEGGRGALVARAEALASGHDEDQVRVLLGMAQVVGALGHSDDPLESPRALADLDEQLIAAAGRCGRDDWLCRVLGLRAHKAYTDGDTRLCEDLLTDAGVAAARLGSPRFICEVDILRAFRLLDRGRLGESIALLDEANVDFSRLRPDAHAFVTLMVRWGHLAYGEGRFDVVLPGLRALAEGNRAGVFSAWHAMWLAMSGRHEEAWAKIDHLLTPGLERLRHPDVHVETSLVYLSIASAWIGHRQAGAQLRPLVERLRGRWLSPIPTMMWGFPAEHAIGVLDLLAGREDDAVVELYAAVERLDAQARPLIGAWSRQALAQALHANGEPDEARRVVAESIDLAQQSGFGFFVQTGRRLEAEFDGRPPATPPEPARTKPLRSLAARSGRRALAALVRNQDDAALETRFASARRQRGLLRAMARGFQPEQALGFTGVIAYELEPFEIAAPPEAPWRWTIAIDGRTARLVEPAPLDADITIHFGLADWVRVLAGELQPVTSMAAGRCRVEGDIVTASRLEAIFGVV